MHAATININGNDLYYEFHTHPSATETVLLIHGFLSSTFSFRRLVPLLKENFQVIAIDFPPFGKSGKSRQFTYSFQNIAQSIIDLCDHLEIKQISLIGHSMGGQLSLRISHLKPQLVRRNVLLSSSSYLKKSKRPLVFVSYLPFFHYYVKYHLARSGVEKNLRNVVHDHSLIDDEMFQGYLQPFLANDIFAGLTRMIRHREDDLSSEELRKIEIPSLLIWGKHDRVVPLHVGKKLQQDLPNAELIVLEETGHLVPEEKPDIVYNHIKDFLLA